MIDDICIYNIYCNNCDYWLIIKFGFISFTFDNDKNCFQTISFINRSDSKGVQCTIALHVDDLLISSGSTEMIESLCVGLKRKYGDMSRTDGPVVNYLGMIFGMRHPGEARVERIV